MKSQTLKQQSQSSTNLVKHVGSTWRCDPNLDEQERNWRLAQEQIVPDDEIVPIPVSADFWS